MRCVGNRSRRTSSVREADRGQDPRFHGSWPLSFLRLVILGGSRRRGRRLSSRRSGRRHSLPGRRRWRLFRRRRWRRRLLRRRCRLLGRPRGRRHLLRWRGHRRLRRRRRRCLFGRRRSRLLRRRRGWRCLFGRRRWRRLLGRRRGRGLRRLGWRRIHLFRRQRARCRLPGRGRRGRLLGRRRRRIVLTRRRRRHNTFGRRRHVLLRRCLLLPRANRLGPGRRWRWRGSNGGLFAPRRLGPIEFHDADRVGWLGRRRALVQQLPFRLPPLLSDLAQPLDRFLRYQPLVAVHRLELDPVPVRLCQRRQHRHLIDVGDVHRLILDVLDQRILLHQRPRRRQEVALVPACV